MHVKLLSPAMFSACGALHREASSGSGNGAESTCRGCSPAHSLSCTGFKLLDGYLLLVIIALLQRWWVLPC